MTWHPDSLPNLSGKVYIVTGGTAGIGFCTVARLAQHGAHVYLCARSETKGKTAADKVKAQYSTANVSYLVMDHTSLTSVVAAAKDFLSREQALHGLVNNAGIMAIPYKMTEDGYEEQWQTNHVAHWLFTAHLLPLMLETSKGLPSGSVRVVNLTSGGHMMAPKGGINFANTALPDNASIDRYGQGKLANVLHIKAINKHYGPDSPSAKAGNGEIWTAVIHPGIVKSQLNSHASEMPVVMRVVTALYSNFGMMLETDEASWTSVYCVSSPEMQAAQSGTYFTSIVKTTWLQSKLSKDLELAERLETWSRSEMKKKGFWP